MYDDHLDFVWRRLLNLRVPGRMLEDITADVWAQVCLVWDDPQRGYDPSRPIRPWLATITFRVAVDRIRRLSLESRVMTTLDHEPAAGSVSPERQAEAMDAVRALATLPEDKATALFLVEVEGLTAEEVADTMGISVHKARRVVTEGRESLRAQLERKGRSFGVAAPLLGSLLDSDDASGPPSSVRVRLWRRLPDAIARRAAASPARRATLGARLASLLVPALLGAVVAGVSTVALLRLRPSLPTATAADSAATASPIDRPAVAPVPTVEVAAEGTPAPQGATPTARASLPPNGAASVASGSSPGASAGARGTPAGPEYQLLTQARIAQARNDRAAALATLSDHRRRFPTGPTSALVAARDRLEQEVLAMPVSAPPSPP